jgi:hypothetical protein
LTPAGDSTSEVRDLCQVLAVAHRPAGNTAPLGDRRQQAGWTSAWMAGALESGRAMAKAVHMRAARDAPQTAVA